MVDFYTRGAVSGKQYKRRDKERDSLDRDKIQGRFRGAQYIPAEQVRNEREQKRKLEFQKLKTKGKVDIAKTRGKSAAKRKKMGEKGATERTEKTLASQAKTAAKTRQAEEQKAARKMYQNLITPTIDEVTGEVKSPGRSAEEAQSIVTGVYGNIFGGKEQKPPGRARAEMMTGPDAGQVYRLGSPRDNRASMGGGGPSFDPRRQENITFKAGTITAGTGGSGQTQSPGSGYNYGAGGAGPTRLGPGTTWSELGGMVKGALGKGKVGETEQEKRLKRLARENSNSFGY